MKSQENTNTIIIDVREPKEFKDGNIPGSINLPSSTFTIDQYNGYRNNSICLVCQTGRRAKMVKEKLENNGFHQVTLLETQMADLHQFHKTTEKQKGWSVDRQFRMTLGVLLAIFLFGYHFGYPNFIVIPTILCIGLIFTSIIDKCYMRIGIAMLPWNKGKSN